MSSTNLTNLIAPNSTPNQRTNYTQMAMVRCMHTGIAYTVNTDLYCEMGGTDATRPTLPSLGVVLNHPMSHMNVVKQAAPLFSANKIGNTLAAGALFTILQHHNLMILHDTDTIYAANHALCSGFSQAALNRLVYRWLTNDKRVSQAMKRSNTNPSGTIPKFDIGTVNPSCGEYRNEHHHFIACFKTWMYEVLQPTQEELMRAAAMNAKQEREKAEIVQNVGRLDISGIVVKGVNDGIHNEGVSRYDQSILDYNNSDLDVIISNKVNEASRESRRKSPDQIVTKIKGHLSYAHTKLNLLTEAQYDHLLGAIQRQKILPVVFDATCIILEKYIIQHERAVTTTFMGTAAANNMTNKRRVLKVIEILAWFKILNRIFNDTDASSFVVEGDFTVETEPQLVVRDSNDRIILDEIAETLPPMLSLMERINKKNKEKLV